MGIDRKYFQRGFWSRYILKLIHTIYFKIVLSFISGVFEHQNSKTPPLLTPIKWYRSGKANLWHALRVKIL